MADLDPSKPQPVADPRKVPLSRRLLLGGAVGLAAGAAVFLVSGSWLWQSFELRTLDWRQRLLARKTAAVDQVAIVLVDESSVELEKRENSWYWPWPRDAYLPLLGFLEKAGARAVAFDLILADPHRSGTDKDLAEAVAASGKVTVAAKLDGFPREAESEAAGLEKAAVDIEGWTFPPRKDQTRFLPPFPELVSAVRGLGFVNILQDPDNTIRRADLALTYPETGKEVGSLALDAVRTALGRELPLRVEGRTLLLGDRRIPLGRDGRPLIRYYGGKETFRTVGVSNAWRSLFEMEEGKPPLVPLDALKDRIVIVGVNIAGMEDVVSAPTHPAFLGPELHATICANILGEEFLRELPDAQRLGLLLALGLVAGFGAFLAWRALRAAAALALLVAAYSGLALLAFRGGLVVDLFGAWAVVGAVLVAEVVAAYLGEGRGRREVAKAFGQYLSPDVIRELLQNPDALKLGGESRRIAVTFSDIKGFSTFSEGMTPHELVAFLNVYLSRMTDVILDRKGLVDKYVGDLIMAFWGAPAAVERPALQACLATIEQRKVLAELNERFAAEGRPHLDFRLGLNVGAATVGNMGSTRRFNYTAMGDMVNLASRLEGANKFFGTNVLMTAEAREDAGDEVVARRLGKVRVVGKGVPTELYELVGRRGEVPDEVLGRIARFEAALGHLETGRAVEARAGFEALLAEREDPFVKKCLARCREVESGTAWDGVWVLTEKG